MFVETFDTKNINLALKENVIADEYRVSGIIPFNLINSEALRHYEILTYEAFLKWNKQRKRGFYYVLSFIKSYQDALSHISYIDESDWFYYVPNVLLPLIIKHKWLAIVLAPRIPINDKRLSKKNREILKILNDTRLNKDYQKDW